MFLNEAKVFFENVKNFRKMPLNEAVDSNVFVDAIQNNKFLYIEYQSPKTKQTGYRTIKPFIVGTDNNGTWLLRAWQETGVSDSFSGLGKRRRYNHEYHVAKTGTRTIKPGWRLFKLEYIKSAMPTGKIFSISDRTTSDLYKPNDAQIPNATAYITIKTGKPDTNDIIDSSSQFDAQMPPGTRQFFALAPKEREATPQEIEYWYYYAKTRKPKQPEKYDLAYTDGGDMILRDAGDPKVLQDSIVGNIATLYDEIKDKLPPRSAFSPFTTPVPTTEPITATKTPAPVAPQTNFSADSSFTTKKHSDAIAYFDSKKNKNV